MWPSLTLVLNILKHCLHVCSALCIICPFSIWKISPTDPILCSLSAPLASSSPSNHKYYVTIGTANWKWFLWCEGQNYFPFVYSCFPNTAKIVSRFEVHLFLVWYQVSNLSSGREDKKWRRYLLGYCYFVKHFKSPTSHLLPSTVISRFKIQYQVRHRHKGSFSRIIGSGMRF